ncbi:MAG: heme A synthase [Acidimicrobiia bacterium]
MTKAVAFSSRLRLPAAAGAAAAGTYLLIVLGAVVRATGSGLGCPDWPTCHGSWIPPWERTALIEYSHRSLALIVGLMVAAVFWLAWRQRHGHRREMIVASISVGLLLVQAGLGRQVVLGELDARLVTVHLSTAMLLLAALVFLATRPARGAALSAAARPYWLAAGGVFLVIALGAFVRGENAGLAFTDWPLMDGTLLPGSVTDSVPDLAQFLHRAAVLLVGIYLVRLVFAVRSGSRPGGVRTASIMMLALYLAQAALGAANIWLLLTSWTRVGHVALASLLWSVAFMLPFAAARPAAAESPSRRHTLTNLHGGR